MNMTTIYELLIKQYENTIEWLEKNNEDEHQQKNISRRKRELDMLGRIHFDRVHDVVMLSSIF